MKLGVCLILLLMLIPMDFVMLILLMILVMLFPNSPKTLSPTQIGLLGDSTKVVTLHSLTVKETPKWLVVWVTSEMVPQDK